MPQVRKAQVKQEMPKKGVLTGDAARWKRERRNWIQFFPLNPSLGPPLSATAFYISRTQDEAQEVERKKEKAVDVQLSRAASQGKSIEFN